MPKEKLENESEATIQSQESIDQVVEEKSENLASEKKNIV